MKNIKEDIVNYKWCIFWLVVGMLSVYNDYVVMAVLDIILCMVEFRLAYSEKRS